MTVWPGFPWAHSVPSSSWLILDQNLRRKLSHRTVLQPRCLSLLIPAANCLLPFTACSSLPLSHRRPGILVLVNDADWELLVSTLRGIPPLTASLASGPEQVAA